MRISQDPEEYPNEKSISLPIKIGLVAIGIILLTRVLSPSSKLHAVKELERKWRKK